MRLAKNARGSGKQENKRSKKVRQLGEKNMVGWMRRGRKGKRREREKKKRIGKQKKRLAKNERGSGKQENKRRKR